MNYIAGVLFVGIIYVIIDSMLLDDVRHKYKVKLRKVKRCVKKKIGI